MQICIYIYKFYSRLLISIDCFSVTFVDLLRKLIRIKYNYRMKQLKVYVHIYMYIYLYGALEVVGSFSCKLQINYFRGSLRKLVRMKYNYWMGNLKYRYACVYIYIYIEISLNCRALRHQVRNRFECKITFVVRYESW